MMNVMSQAGLVVMICKLVDEKLQALGTGFVCHSRGFILTSAHILDLTAALRVVIPPPINTFAPLTSGEVNHTAVSILQLDAENDVALLGSNGFLQAQIPLSFFGQGDNTNVSEPVGCLGIPFANRGLHTIKLTSTIVCGKSVTSSGSKRLHLDANLHEGNSGGPVVSSRTGQVIGIVSERFSPVGSGAGIMIGDMPLGADSTISFAVPVEYGLALLKAENVDVH